MEIAEAIEAFKARKAYQIQKLEQRAAETAARLAQCRDELARAPEIVAQLEAARRGAAAGVSINVPTANLDATGN